MKKVLLSLATMIAVPLFALAQFNYNFSVNNQAYQPLSTGSTSLNGTNTWDEPVYKVALPFSFKFNGKTINHFNFLYGNNVADDTVATQLRDAFVLFDADVFDRDTTFTASQSPIRYAVTGTAPNRIFKAEVWRAAFYWEYDLYSTLKDSLCYQVWLYETSNVVEFRYGPSSISHQSDYFELNGTPLVGFLKGVDYATGAQFQKFYMLKGNPANPGLDSTTTTAGLQGLSAYPSNGTVYRFTPKGSSTGVGQDASLAAMKVYPTYCNDLLHIENTAGTGLQYRVINITGSGTALNGSLDKGHNSIDVHMLPQGTYLLQLQGREGQATQRFVKL